MDQVFGPVMATQHADSLFIRLVGTGKGCGAAFLFAILWIAGIDVCLVFRRDPHVWKLE